MTNKTDIKLPRGITKHGIVAHDGPVYTDVQVQNIVRAALGSQHRGRMPSKDDLEEFMGLYADEMGRIHDDQHAECGRALLEHFGGAQAQPAGNARRLADDTRIGILADSSYAEGMKVGYSMGTFGDDARYQKAQTRLYAQIREARAELKAQPSGNSGELPNAQDREDGLTRAARDVIAERRRQISAEGWTPEHDDEHGTGQMAAAAGCYALRSGGYQVAGPSAPKYWPWDESWWKPTTPRRNLVKAGALIQAEIERIDRAAVRAAKGE